MADDSKTEKATPKKRRDERKKGHVLMSKDATAVVTLLASVLMIRIFFRRGMEVIASFILYCMELARGDVVHGISDNVLRECIGVIVRVAGPLLLVSSMAAIIVTMAQTRGLVTFEPLKPKLSKLNPIQGFKRLFSLKSIIEAVKGLLKIAVLLYFIYTALRNLVSVAGRYMYADVNGSVQHALLAIFNMLLRVILAFVVLAVADFFYQRWDFEREMKMTKEEVKEEYKQMEGDPKVKGKIRQIQRQMAQSRMMQQVPEADVIIRNPTHVAVALRYRAGEDEAPVVLAMGADYLAQRIIAIAEAHDILVMENVPLARALFAEAELNRPIPPDLYEAVAEVMVYLYKLGRIQA